MFVSRFGRLTEVIQQTSGWEVNNLQLMRAINQTEKDLFNRLISSGNANLALVSTECQGVETACICYVQPNWDEVEMIPLAVLVNEEIFAMLTAP